MKKLIIHLHSSRTGILSDRKLQKIEEKEKVGVLFLSHRDDLCTCVTFLQWDNGSKAINDGIVTNSCQHHFIRNLSLQTNKVFL